MKTSPIAIRAHRPLTSADSAAVKLDAVSPATSPTPHTQPKQRPRLTVVPEPLRKPSRVWVGAVLAILLISMALGLVINILVSNRQYELVELNSQYTELSQENETLAQQVTQKSAPQNLAQQASELGMVLPATAASIDLSKGTVSGTAEEASKDNKPTSFVASPSVRAAQGVPAEVEVPPEHLPEHQVQVSNEPVQGPPVNTLDIASPQVAVTSSDTSKQSSENATKTSSEKADLEKGSIPGPVVEWPAGQLGH